MKKLLFSGFLLLATVSLFAQTKVDQAKKATAELVQLYQLDEQQTAKMLKIQERYFQNDLQIEALKTSDPDLYQKKRISNKRGTEASIKMILTKEQMTVFNQQKLQKRKQEAALIKKMKAEGASKEEIQKAILQSQN